MASSFDAVPLGARVVVRARLDPRSEAPPDGPSMTDAVGTLTSRSATEIVVATRRGDVVISRDRIVAAKEVPPRPSRRGAAHLAPTVAELQRISGPAWGAIERELLGDWELRASSGFTQRGNSVLPVGDPGLPLSHAVDRVEAWYAVRDLPARVSLAGPVGFDPADDPLGRELMGRGWTVGDRTLNLTASTAAVAAADSGGPEVHLSHVLDDAWLAAYGHSRDTSSGVASAVLTASPDQLFASITPGGGLTEPVAIGRLGLAHGWAGLGAVWTDPAFRGRGLAHHITAALAARARADGIHLLHLQVEEDNATALRLYERLGFAHHSSYVYVVGPDPT